MAGGIYGPAGRRRRNVVLHLRLPGGAGHEPQHGSAACRELYRLSGFLHWGFNYYIGDDIWHSACCPHKGALLPAGDAHIVYPGKDGRPWRSMRFEAQRAGAEDYELLMQAVDAAPGEADALVRTVCTTFRSYARSGAAVAAARLRLFRLLEEVARNG